MATTPTLVYTGRDFAGIKAELLSFIQATRPDDWADFSSSSLGTALIELIAYSHDILSYGQDAMAQELFLDTARRYESVLRFAKSVGYSPQTASAASVVVSGTITGSALTNGMLFSSGQSITALNGFKYELLADAVISANTSTANLTLYQGETRTETFEPTRETNQTFTAAAGVVSRDSWSVFVGDPTQTSNRWTQVDAVAFELSATETYEADFDENGKLIVKFGDGTNGKIPESSVTVTYRITDGALGNSNPETITGTLSGSIVGQGSSTASVSFSNPASATGGSDRESVEAMKKSVPSFLKSLDKVITLDDYEKMVPVATSAALCFADVPLASYSGNIIRVNIWDSATQQFTASSPSGLASTVDYDKYQQATDMRAYEVQKYLSTRSPATAHTVVNKPTTSSVNLTFSSVVYDGNYDAETVHSDISSAVVRAFETGSGFSLSLSDLYAEVLGVSGVSQAVINQIVWTHKEYDPNHASRTYGAIYTDTYNADGSGDGPLKDLVVLGVDDREYYDDANLYAGEITYQGSIDSQHIEAITLDTLSFELNTQ
jgi:hypothetical protein